MCPGAFVMGLILIVGALVWIGRDYCPSTVERRDALILPKF